MTCKSVCKGVYWTVAAAIVSLGASPVRAADFGATGGQYGGAAIPVPAPVPVPDIIDSQYYIRFDAGSTFETSAELENIGSYFELKNPSDLATSFFGSVGMGKYLTPALRAEVSFSVHDDIRLADDNALHYTELQSARGPNYTDPVSGTVFNTFDTHHYDVTRTEELKFAQSYGLFSLYYDIHTGTAFTPYVGAGVGVAWRQLKRRYTESAVCNHTTNTHDTYPVDSCIANAELPLNYDVSSSTNVSRWDLTAALMAGFAYEFAEGMYWDTSYRYLWQNGAISVTAPTITGDSTVVLDSLDQHQIMSGLRFDIN